MEKRFWIRTIFYLSIWIPLLIWSIVYVTHEQNIPHFDFLLSSNGVVSNLQQEHGMESSKDVLPNDRLISVNGIPFSHKLIKKWLSNQHPNQEVKLVVDRNHTILEATTYLKRYTKNGLLIMFYLPLLLSIIFLCFAIGVGIKRIGIPRSRQAVEVFGLLCFGISAFFITLLPMTSLGSYLSFSLVVPLIAVLVLHLFLVYPKEKCPALVRNSLLGFGYLVAIVLAVVRYKFWKTENYSWIHSTNIPILGICLLIAFGSLMNTLLTSKDFWARRRARLMSLVLVASFVGMLSVFVAFVWQVQRLSVERILAVSLFFPTAFGAIFMKSNVFDIERIFRKGLHQFLLLAMAITFAVLVGIGWSQWRIAPHNDWMLWAAIAIVVAAISRPAGNWFENALHRLIQTRVRYPKVNEIFEKSNSLEAFLTTFASECESSLAMTELQFRFFLDPTLPWKPTNEQMWIFRKGSLSRVYETDKHPTNESPMSRADVEIGMIGFEGGDALAFDPKTSRDWAETVRSVARSIELLCLREFIAIQQGFLAVGRMQSLLAHEMKNPLAIIKVCSGLLSTRFEGNEEAEELIRTIQGEVKRVAEAVQGIFDNSGKADPKEKIGLSSILHQVKETALGRFPDRSFEIQVFSNGKSVESTEIPFYLWTEKEGLRQSLTNLVVNAYEAGSDWVGVDVYFHKHGVHIWVQDRGEGLPEKIDLFKPFVTTKPNGTGLGLAHVKAFMDRNLGHIRVHSKRGEGTVFILEFSRQSVFQ